jgi:hypothetical protein
MARVTLRWHQDRVVSRVRTDTLRRAQIAATVLERNVKARLGTPGPPASRPGQPPRRRSGALQRGVRATARLVNQFRVRVAVSVAAFYAPFLQRGTRRMARRPITGYAEDTRAVVDILSGRRRS